MWIRIKFLLPLLLLTCLILCMITGGTALAESTDTITEAKEAGLAMPVQSNSISGWPEGPAISSPAAILMDMDTGAVLYAKNINDQHYPASITKIMTALLAVEKGQANQSVVFSHDAVYNIETGSANVGMKEGEEITLDEALRCMMSASANECANAIAETIGGTNDNFIQMMNDKAAELGCTNTHFVNPHGLFDANHYVSARDMALIAQAAYKNSWFRDICCLQTYNRPLTALNDDAWCISNKHKMFKEGSPYYYEGCTGGKTGYTVEARNTLVTFAERNGLRLVCVVLQTEGYDVYTNTAALFDYGFGSFSHVSIADNADPTVIASVTKKDADVTLPTGAVFADTTREITPDADSSSGTVTYFYHNNIVGDASVKLAETVASTDSETSVDSDQSTADTGQVSTASSTAVSYKQLLNNKFLLIAGAAAICCVIFAIAAIARRVSRGRQD